MMLRNRDLNVQKNNNGAEATKAHQQLKANVAGAGAGGKPVNLKPGAHLQKRQAPQLVGGGGHRAAESSNGSLEAAEPRPKRACSQNDKDKENINPHHHQNNNLPRRNVNNNENAAVAVVPVSAFSRSLLIDSAKKESAGNNNNNDAAPVANRRVSVVGAPLAGRRRTSALAVRDTNAAAEIAVQQPLKSSSQEKNNNVIATSQKEEKREDEQKMEVAEQLVVEPVVVLDFDKENERDLSAVSQYAQDIFTYYKYREPFFRVSDYISHAKHPDVTTEKRVKLVDWMVELQETFELNHETLYLGVKLVDLFLNHTKVKVVGQQLQLIASAAVFIASKFDERAPPLIDDFIYMAEDSFSRDQLLEMERELLKVVEFDLGAPLSYRFLRRYARVSKLDMGTLTLARYVLETSLMFLNFCRESESLIAAACLLLAVRMKGIGDWGPILDKYSGYTRAEVEPLMWRLNQMVDDRKKNYPYQDTVFRKYSHEIFFEVAKVKLLREH